MQNSLTEKASAGAVKDPGLTPAEENAEEQLDYRVASALIERQQVTHTLPVSEELGGGEIGMVGISVDGADPAVPTLFAAGRCYVHLWGGVVQCMGLYCSTGERYITGGDHALKWLTSRGLRRGFARALLDAAADRAEQEDK